MAPAPIWTDPRYAVVFRGAEALLAHVARHRRLEPELAELWAVEHRLVLRALTGMLCEPARAEPERAPAARGHDAPGAHHHQRNDPWRPTSLPPTTPSAHD